MTESEKTQLLQDIKDYLKITWNDEATDKNLSGMMNRGMAYLNNIAGAPLDFVAEDLSKQLLLDYCRYANSQALEMFSINFRCELSWLHYSQRIREVIVE